MRALETSKLFAGLSQPELDALKACAQEKEFQPGEPIFAEGDPGDGFYLIEEGFVQISAWVRQEEQGVLAKLGPGEFFGEMSVLDNDPRSATARADTATQVWFIPRDEISKLLDHSPRLAVNLVREFSRRMREFNRQYVREVLQAERCALVGRFARSIVHDFKNPLNIIGIAAEMAGLPNASPEMRTSASQRIRKQIDRLSNMINELLEFTRGAGAPIVLAQRDFGEYAKDILQETGPELAERSVELILQTSYPSATVLMDPNRLTHVFYNLIHNAVDAMPMGGKIFVRFIPGEKELVTEFEDTGKGIAPEIQTRLFEAFATHGKAQGTGLGLSICKKIIEDHRGWIRARNEPGGGAVFAFGLPLAGEGGE